MRRFLLLLLFLQGCSTQRAASMQIEPPVPTVQLRYASLPTRSKLSSIAVHCFFVHYDFKKRRWRRSELWRTGGLYHTEEPRKDPHRDPGQLRVDLFGPNSDIGGDPVVIVKQWTGEEAVRIERALKRREDYPLRHRYWVWPGPNSNTYIAWILRAANVSADLPPEAIGKDDLGFIGIAPSTTKTGLQIETPVLGAKVGLLDGVEVHILALTLGVDFWPPALETPFGRLGIAESMDFPD